MVLTITFCTSRSSRTCWYYLLTLLLEAVDGVDTKFTAFNLQNFGVLTSNRWNVLEKTETVCVVVGSLLYWSARAKPYETRLAPCSRGYILYQDELPNKSLVAQVFTSWAILNWTERWDTKLKGSQFKRCGNCEVARLTKDKLSEWESLENQN